MSLGTQPTTSGAAATMPSIIFSKIISSIVISADKSLLTLTHKYKLLQILHKLLSFSLYCTLYFLRLLLSLYPIIPLKSFDFLSLKPHFNNREKEFIQSINNGDYSSSSSTSIGRALSQILSIMNEVPVSSRKYELVRSLAENLIDENLKLGFDVHSEINCTVLSSAFARTLSQLEKSMLQEVEGNVGFGPFDYRLNRILSSVRSFGDSAWFKFGKTVTVSRAISGSTAEKFAAELLWLAKKMSACGNGEVAVSSWGSASKLAWLSLSAEPRLQGSLVKLSAFLLKEAKEMGQKSKEAIEGESEDGNLRQKKMMMLLMSWLPFLCRASNGTDAPVLSTVERVEVERIIEDIIEMLKQEDEQEKVLGLWLQNFTSCPLSDFPNLQPCYARWCEASRKLLAIS